MSDWKEISLHEIKGIMKYRRAIWEGIDYQDQVESLENACCQLKEHRSHLSSIVM